MRSIRAHHQGDRRKFHRLFQLLVPSLLLASCYTLSGCGEDSAGADVAGASQNQGQQKQQSGSPTSYPEVKSMVLDILHSKEGMATLQDTMSSPEFKRATAITNGDIQAAVEKTLQQGQNKHFLADQMKDTQFAAAVVKAAEPQMMDIQRQLMRDPTYQKDLLTLMKSPEFQQSQLELLKSPEYRKEVMKIMTEALQEPTFRLLFTDSMKEAVKAAGGGQQDKMDKQQQSKDKSKDKDSGGEKEEGGEDSDSGEDSGGGS
ncbi:MAG: spore germination lipoprotein GerD [Firmicutes bacterium]|nr:spore germination lipoprotein GerD [Bacillota bacterium]